MHLFFFSDCSLLAAIWTFDFYFAFFPSVEYLIVHKHLEKTLLRRILIFLFVNLLGKHF